MRFVVATFMLFLAGTVVAPAAAIPDRAEPRILTLRALDPPVAGRAIRIQIDVRDPLAAINGVQVAFGDRLADIKQSACRPRHALTAPFRPGGPARFVVAHAYAVPGVYTLQVTATSGDCVVGPLSSRRDLRLRVRTPRPTDGLPVTTSQTAGCAAADAVPTSATTAATWRAVLCLTNALRRANDVAPLKSNRRLRRAARGHARDMVARDYFAHESPNGATFADRLRRARYRAVDAGENLGAGGGALATPVAMIIGWIDSPPHRANLLEPRFDEAGVGVAAGFPGGESGATYVLAAGRR